MADASTTRLGLLQMEEGSHSNEWGDLTNVNIGRLDVATRGFKEIVVTTAQTLDATDISTTSTPAEDESFFHWIEFTGTPGTPTAITVQAEEMGWCVLNNTDSIINFTPSGGTLTALAVGKSYMLVYVAADTAFTNFGAVPGDFTGELVTTNTTDSTSGSTGSIHTAGGIGAVKDIVTDATVKALGDTAAGDAAAMGYTATEGLILTGQGSTNDVTIKNDADEDVITIPTGTQQAGFVAYSETAVQYSITSGTIDLNVANATYFYPSGDFSANTPTFTFSNPVATGRVSSFTMELLGADGATITWPTSVDWPSATEPTWSSGVDIVSFITRDGGTTWLGFLGGKDFS